MFLNLILYPLPYPNFILKPIPDIPHPLPLTITLLNKILITYIDLFPICISIFSSADKSSSPLTSNGIFCPLMAIEIRVLPVCITTELLLSTLILSHALIKVPNFELLSSSMNIPSLSFTTACSLDTEISEILTSLSCPLPSFTLFLLVTLMMCIPRLLFLSEAIASSTM